MTEIAIVSTCRNVNGNDVNNIVKTLNEIYGKDTFSLEKVSEGGITFTGNKFEGYNSIRLNLPSFQFPWLSENKPLDENFVIPKGQQLHLTYRNYQRKGLDNCEKLNFINSFTQNGFQEEMKEI
jgi:hypothetical protein